MMNKNKREINDILYKKIKINNNYRFFNSNYCFEDKIIPFFKHEAIVEKLKNRIQFSNGGSFLITGLRGVGKSTIVKRVINELNSKCVCYLPIHINLATNIEYGYLIFEILRRLYESIIDANILNKLNSVTANSIVLAYSRTSMSITRSNNVSGEIESSVDNSGILGNILIKNKITQHSAEEATFLAYSNNDAEHDLIRIIELLSNANNYKHRNSLIKVIIVFDELDKLTLDECGEKYFEDILLKLKNVLCSINAISIFIGGIDLYEKWNKDTAKINSLYDSIFSWHQYIPCIWDSTDTLFNLILEKYYVYDEIEDDLKYLCQNDYLNLVKFPFRMWLTYINFKSKGIPRKIYSEFNNFIIWINETPYFQMNEIDIEKIYAYVAIWEKIHPIFENKQYKTIIEMELTFVICFNMIEFFSSNSNVKFTIMEIRNTLLYDGMLNINNVDAILLDIIQKFVKHHIIKEVQKDVYIVTDLTINKDKNIVIKDKNIVNHSLNKYTYFEEKKTQNDIDNSFRRKIKKYESNEIISFWDKFNAIELISSNIDMSIYFVINNTTREHFNAILYTEKQNEKLENKLCLYKNSTYNFASKYLLDCTDIISNSIIQTSLREIYDGYLLSHIIESKIKLQYIVLIIEQLLEFIKEINEKGYFNANIKSNNIMINKFLNVKVIDIKNLIKVGSYGNPIVSLGYAAPEMYTDEYDKRCDIYSVGVLLWEMVNGICINRIIFERNIEFRFLEKPIHCSKKLWKIIIKATQSNPNNRYQEIDEFLIDIRKCKEYRINTAKVTDEISFGTVTNLSIKEIGTTLGFPNTENSNNIYTRILLDKSSTAILQTTDESVKGLYLIRTLTNEIIIIDKPVFKIGKSKEQCDFYCNDNNMLSRLHASIITKNNKLYLIDNFSTNHTYLNDNMLIPNVEYEIKDKDEVTLANETFIVKNL